MPDGASYGRMMRVAGQGISGDLELAFLRRTDSYPEHPTEVEIVETRFAWVFLTDTRAFKLKKSVKGDGFDFRSVDARRRNALTEARIDGVVVQQMIGRSGAIELLVGLSEDPEPRRVFRRHFV